MGVEFRGGLLELDQEDAIEAGQAVAIVEIAEGEPVGQSKGAVTPRVIWLIHGKAGIAARREPGPLLLVCQMAMRVGGAENVI